MGKLTCCLLGIFLSAGVAGADRTESVSLTSGQSFEFAVSPEFSFKTEEIGGLTTATISAPAPDERIRITELPEAYELAVPGKQLVMTIPKDGLTQRKKPASGSEHPGYFFFEDRPSNLILSGWFESAQNFTGVEALWESEVAAWKKKSLPPPQDVQFEKIGNWDVIRYEKKIPGFTNSHIRAHWIGAGTWIDLHISMTGKLPVSEARARLLERLKTIQVRIQK